MKTIYFWSVKIQKRDILLSVVALIIVAATIICRVSAYEETVASVVSWKVANRVVVIDPGHGGIDPGAIGKSGTLEKDVTLEIAKRVEKLLSNAGAIVILTRDSDSDLCGKKPGSLYEKKRRDLANRVEIANKNQADIYLSLHLNSFPSSRWTGAQTFYQRGQEKSCYLAECVQAAIKTRLKNTKRNALAEDFYTNRHTKMPSVTVELGFLSNYSEEKLLQDVKYQEKMSMAIYTGIAKYFVTEGKMAGKGTQK